MSKSHVGMGHAVCPVCGKEHDEVVLIQMKLGVPPRLTTGEFTGFELCPEHKQKFDEGYLALVAVNGEPPKGSLIEQYNWSVGKRTGELVHIRRTVAKQLFNIAIPDTMEFLWVEPGVVEHLKKLQQEAA